MRSLRSRWWRPLLPWKLLTPVCHGQRRVRVVTAQQREYQLLKQEVGADNGVLFPGTEDGDVISVRRHLCCEMV